MRTNTTVIVVGLLCVLSWDVSVFAATIHVPADQPTIQAGIDAAIAGDTVLVASGTYTGSGNRDIDFNGKGVVLKSASGADSTIIDCLDISRAFIIESKEDSSTIIDGFTIQNGFHWLKGGAIYIDSASPTIRNSVFDHNNAFHASGGAGSGRGGAIYCIEGSPLIEYTSFTWNSANYGQLTDAPYGGAIYSLDSSPELVGCSFYKNSALDGGAVWAEYSSLTFVGCSFASNLQYWNTFGGGVNLEDCNASFRYCDFSGNRASAGGAAALWASTVSFEYCVFRGNRARFGGAVELAAYDNCYIKNCTFVDNSSWDGAAGLGVESSSAVVHNTIFSFSSEGPTIQCWGADATATLINSDIFGNAGGDWVDCIADQYGVNGNISVDPLFCDTAAFDFHIDSASPCAPGNHESGELIGAYGVGCNGPRTLIDPETLLVLQAYNLDSLEASIYFGDLRDGHTVDDIDESSLVINGTLLPDSIHSPLYYPSFFGQVLELSIQIAPFILSYGPLYDTTDQSYTVSGSYNDGETFVATGQFTMIGHLSGDINLDGSVDVADLTYLVEYLFGGGPPPRLIQTADFDGSGMVDVSDLSAMVEYLFP